MVTGGSGTTVDGDRSSLFSIRFNLDGLTGSWRKDSSERVGQVSGSSYDIDRRQGGSEPADGRASEHLEPVVGGGNDLADSEGSDIICNRLVDETDLG